jgi:hypothetical protein
VRPAPREPAAEGKALLKARELVCQPSNTSSLALYRSRLFNLLLRFVLTKRFERARCHSVAFINPTVVAQRVI